MNKQELVDRVAEEHELTGRFARELVDNIFDLITGAVQKGEEVSLFGFGSFKIAERAARQGRNPRTGESMEIAAKSVPRFSAGAELKKAAQ